MMNNCRIVSLREFSHHWGEADLHPNTRTTPHTALDISICYGGATKMVIKLGWTLKARWKGFLTGPSITNITPTGLSYPPFPLPKLLDYIPKANPQALLLYLASSLCLTKTLRSSYQNTKVRQSKFILWLHWLTCQIRTYQLTLTQTFPFFLKKKKTLLQRHLLSVFDRSIDSPSSCLSSLG